MGRFGHNRGYIDELFGAYRENPASVSEAWQEFFRDYREEPSPGVPGTAPPSAEQPVEIPETSAQPIRGIAARIVENMVDSLTVPTATSCREIPVKLLEENRRILNQHQATVVSARLSFTHLIGWAIVRALAHHPRMNAHFEEIGGKPHLAGDPTVNLGLAIDVKRKGERVLLVPKIPSADTLTFPEFLAAYNDLVVRCRDNRIQVDEYSGTTLTLTNPGMLGTAMSVPRLMRGQGAIIGVGRIGYPAAYAGVASQKIGELGLSRTMTITSTYDHRVIQGAESGGFLATIDRLLQGEEAFYTTIFSELGVPREPVEWSADSDSENHDGRAKQAGVSQLIRAFRVRGHLWADLDPLGYEPQPNSELELATYGLGIWDLDRSFLAGSLSNDGRAMKLRDILDTLQRTYCRRIGVEYMHIAEPDLRHWVQRRLEDAANEEPLPRDTKIRIMKKLNAAEAFETFLHTNYVGQKRFSLEGAETLIPMLDTLMLEALDLGIEQVVMGMAHRGRLNVLANVVGKSYSQVFQEFEGMDPDSTLGSGDVKYHLGARGRLSNEDGRSLDIKLSSNPSHLEAVNPVVEGMVRARQDCLGDKEHKRVLAVLIHGDGAFSGQGVVAETLHLSRLRGYRTGGTVHIIVNNQIGFTTGPQDLKSSLYPTDVAKMVGAPIFHVNGDHPEQAVRVIRHALAFRSEFQRDVVVNMVCYRRWGHNEADEPSYTHPLLYSKIKNHRSVRKLYTEELLRSGDFDPETTEKALEDFRKRLQEAHDTVLGSRDHKVTVEPATPTTPSSVPTAVPTTSVNLGEHLERTLTAMTTFPAEFHVHPKLDRQFQQRRKRYEDGKIDWGQAESLAFGSLVQQGVHVRLSGEDCGRGTFSQRHATLYDHSTAERYTPLSHIDANQASFQVFDSLLSEFAVLGFEYGYSVDHPGALVLWEAQFGDFANGAQVVIDQFVASAHDKWGQESAVTMLLPHGYEGQGPEHSSARLERFLQLAADRNIRVAYPSTPAQYFHLLRRQALAVERCPLVVMTPKSLLRHPACVSTADDLIEGSFQELLAPDRDPGGVRRVVLCSGKVYYDLTANSERLEGIVIGRLEQLFPLDVHLIRDWMLQFPNATDWIWVQEEPRNMGAWTFLRETLDDALTAAGMRLRYVGRAVSASTATGSHRRHLEEQNNLVDEALAVQGSLQFIGKQ